MALDHAVPIDSSQKRSKAWPVTLLIFGAYALLAVIMTWPVVSKLGVDLAGSHSDLWIHQWTFWWIKKALLEGANPFYTNLLYYPYGVSLTSHNIAWFNIALWLPLQAVVGNVAAYNLVFIAVYALNGFSFYLFAHELTESRAASFVGGVIFGFWPYTLSHNDHPNMVVLFWVPLSLLFMHRLYTQQKLRYALLLGLSIAMTGISRWQLLVMSAPILFAYALYLFWSDKSGRHRRTVVMLLFSGLFSLLLMVPLAAPLVRDQLQREDTAEVDVLEKEGVTDVLSYVIPPQLYNYFWRDVEFPSWFLEPYENIAASVHYVPFIGYLTLLLAIYGAVKKWPRTWFWTLLAVAYILFALGTTLTFDGQKFPAVPVPYRLLEGSIVDALIRRPHRLNLFLSIPVAMLVTWALVALLEWLRARSSTHKRSAAMLLLAVIGFVILWENPISPPYPTTSTEIPRWYQQLADEPGDFGILELPTYDRGFDKIYMFNQIQHGKPIMGGHVSRLPAEANAFRESIPFLLPMLRQDAWLVELEDWVDFADIDITRQFRQLAEANVRYVVVNKPLLTKGALERWIDWVALEPIYEDESVLVYRTEPQAGTDFIIEKKLTEDVGLIRAFFEPSEAVQGGTVKLDLRWGSDKAPAADYEACLRLLGRSGQDSALHCLEIIPGFPTSDWKANELVRGAYVLPLDQEIEVGDYDLQLFLSEVGEQPVGETAELGKLHIYPFQPQFHSTVCWEDKICLKGYDLEQEGTALHLTAYWQAPRNLLTSNKLFIHIVDPESGQVVAQSDTIPRGWSYPTDIWEPGEIVRDPLSISLENVPAGKYLIRLGWYGVDDGLNLRACPTGACGQETSDTFQLTTIDLDGQ